LGTLTRILYLVGVAGVIYWLGERLGYLKIDRGDEQGVINFLRACAFSKVECQLIVATALGMFGADAVHILLDGISSFWKKVKRELL
jgi:uncharacterized metal-binding protein